MSELDDEPKPPPVKLKIKRAKVQEEPEAPPERPISIGGFGENVLNNLWDIAKGFVNVFPTAIKSGAQVFGDPEGMALLAQNPEHLVTAIRDTANNVKNAFIEPYRKHGLRVLYEEPITPVMDAMTVLSLGGGALAKAGALTKSEKLFQVGNALKS